MNLFAATSGFEGCYENGSNFSIIFNITVVLRGATKVLMIDIIKKNILGVEGEIKEIIFCIVMFSMC